MYREALDIRRESFTAGHPDILVSVRILGALLQARGSLADAEPLLREALAISKGRLGARHDFTRRTAIALSDLLDRTDRPEEAAAMREMVFVAAPTRPGATGPATRTD